MTKSGETVAVARGSISAAGRAKATEETVARRRKVEVRLNPMFVDVGTGS